MAVCTICWNDKELTQNPYSLGDTDRPQADLSAPLGRIYVVTCCKGCHYNLRKSVQIIRTLGQSQLRLEEGSEGEGEPPVMEKVLAGEATLGELEDANPPPAAPGGAPKDTLAPRTRKKA